jgi:hypothetical protein
MDLLRQHRRRRKGLPIQFYTFDPLAKLTASGSSLILSSPHLLWTEGAELSWSGPGKRNEIKIALYRSERKQGE